MTLQALEYTCTVNAPAGEVYRAFTRAAPLREWLCDTALVEARPGGRVYLWWNVGYYAAGQFTALEEGTRVAFNWQGQGEPGATQVDVRLAAVEGGTALTLVHGGLGDGEAWERARAEFARGWESGLENLASLLETGRDLRLVRRPMLGIYLTEFNAQIAAELGVPVAEGMRLSGVLDGMGAAAAGLVADDVVVSLDGKPARTYEESGIALLGRRAGDTVQVGFYRGAELRQTAMTLSHRSLPEVPPTPAALAEAVVKMNAESLRKIEAALADADEVQAAARPAPDSWSALETLAHLVLNEREFQAWLADLILDDERWSDSNPTVVPARIAALLSVCPALDLMLDELRCALAETEAMVAALPAAVVAHKGSYWRLGYNLLQSDKHVDEHVNQIEAGLKAVSELVS